MRLWIDDVRPAPEGYVWCKSVNEAKFAIELIEIVSLESAYALDKKLLLLNSDERDMALRLMILPIYHEHVYVNLIDIDHDAGEYVSDGGAYIKLLDWLEATGRDYPIRIHSMNPVGKENMRRIIRKNRWQEIK